MRADSFLTVYGYVESRTRAARLIAEGKVLVDGNIVKKASEEIWGEEHTVEITEVDKYVSRGGLKLEAALAAFKTEVKDKRCIDIGASTGGFTDCLLQCGAKSVHCVDSGKGQLHAKIAADERIENIEGFNARELSSEDFGLFDIAVMDVSFISQTLIHAGVSRVLCEGGEFISLIKPQFEAGKQALGKKGIVKDPKDRAAAISRVLESAELHGLFAQGLICSPIEGGDGNREYLAIFKKSSGATDKRIDKREIVEISKR